MPSAMVIFCTMKSFQNGLCLLDISEERLKLTFHPEENWSKKKKKNHLDVRQQTWTQNLIFPYQQQLQLHVKLVSLLCRQLIKEQL